LANRENTTNRNFVAAGTIPVTIARHRGEQKRAMLQCSVLRQSPVRALACWIKCRRKQFFFEKKNQKTFILLSAASEHIKETLNLLSKDFWFFFSKKNCLLATLPAFLECDA
jgi:hypothetical protein